MDVEKGRAKSLGIKMALAITIIRNKPANMSAKEFTQLLQYNFKESFVENKELIDTLKSELLKCRQELLMLKNEKQLENIEKTTNLNLNKFVELNLSNRFSLHNKSDSNNIAKNIKNLNDYEQIKQNYEENVQFLLNIIKLKMISKNFRLDDNVETVINTLSELLTQIRYFFFNENVKQNCNSESNFNFIEEFLNNSSSSLSNVTNVLDMSSLSDTKSTSFYSFPCDSLLHALQIFLNVFQIEWLYYLRNNLMSLLNEFIDDLVKYILECENCQTERVKITCACQMLTHLSTCDYLLDHILTSIIYGIRNLTIYLCENQSDYLVDSVKAKTGINNQTLIENCALMIDCFDSIINLRLLDNYTKISENVRCEINKLLNIIFIQLTDVFPMLAIKMAKLIQLLNFKTKN